MSYDRTSIDLTNCDKEPIHIPGSIQPHGSMIVVDPKSSVIVYSSQTLNETQNRDFTWICAAVTTET